MGVYNPLGYRLLYLSHSPRPNVVSAIDIPQAREKAFEDPYLLCCVAFYPFHSHRTPVPPRYAVGHTHNYSSCQLKGVSAVDDFSLKNETAL